MPAKSYIVIMRKLVLIAHNVRSIYNVGSLFRTAEGLGIDRVCLTGYTPYPEMKKDSRPPHLRAKIDRQIQKTALGAEAKIKWQHYDEIKDCLKDMVQQGYIIVALEQTKTAINIRHSAIKGKAALVVGNEVEGLDNETLGLIKHHVYIPMQGKKESFNVSVAAAMALYHLRYL